MCWLDPFLFYFSMEIQDSCRRLGTETCTVAIHCCFTWWLKKKKTQHKPFFFNTRRDHVVLKFLMLQPRGSKYHHLCYPGGPQNAIEFYTCRRKMPSQSPCLLFDRIFINTNFLYFFPLFFFFFFFFFSSSFFLSSSYKLFLHSFL